MCSLSLEKAEMSYFGQSSNPDEDGGSDCSVRSDIFHLGSSDGEGANETSSPFVNLTVDEKLLKPLYDGAGLTVFGSYSLLLQYSLKHGLTKRSFADPPPSRQHAPSNEWFNGLLIQGEKFF